jgi:hypothetical protein
MALAEHERPVAPATGAGPEAGTHRPWARPLAVGAVAACGCAAIALANPGDDGIPLCWSQGIFGVDCPLCGGIRCVNALVRGDWGAAADHNVLLAVALPLAAVAWTVWLVRALQGRPLRRLRPPSWVWAAVVVVLVAFTVVRNVGGTEWAQWLASDTFRR